jgi:hypothetical protein
MNQTFVYWLIIGGLCLAFPPLVGFVLGVAFFCGLWWLWFKMLGG